MIRKRKVKLVLLVVSFLAISLIPSRAVDPNSGCPESTGGYAATGIRSSQDCNFSVTEHGYWWSIKGEVSWVGAIIAGAGGTFTEADRTVTYTGKEYLCDGWDSRICWGCNCYYMGETPIGG